MARLFSSTVWGCAHAGVVVFALALLSLPSLSRAQTVTILQGRIQRAVLPHLIIEVGRTIVQDFRFGVGDFADTVTIVAEP